MAVAGNVDYSLYLVTDPTPAILRDKDLVEVVEAALKGGVTVVQYRDKLADTAVLVRTARKLHAVTKRYNVPLLINDRVDVALAVGCEGVHIGQDDLDPRAARQLLGASAIIGVSVSSIRQANKACEDGANYLGIGTVFATPTKVDTKCIIGTAGVRAILQAIALTHQDVRTVCIGGINATNIQRVLYQSGSRGKKLDGVAVVSAIIASQDPTMAAAELKHLIDSDPPFVALQSLVPNVTSILEAVPSIIQAVGEKTPLSHNMTNLVVQNLAANIALATGASPIMTNCGLEAEDLCKLGGALVINMGSVTVDSTENYLQSLRAYNLVGGPVVFDPVGAGATALRRSTIKDLMAGGYFDVIKGNEAEISTLYGEFDITQRGVDSGPSTLDTIGKAALVRDLATRERNVIVMTGVTDFVSDGNRTFAVKNGHEYLSRITGSGCALGTTVSAMLAVHRQDKLVATIAGILLFEIAAEIAAEREDVRGPGTFVPAFIDEMHNIRTGTMGGALGWLRRAKVYAIPLK